MTDDQELQPDVSENEEQENRSVKNGNDLSELSLSSASEIDPEEKEIEEEIQNDDLSPQVHDQVDEILHINENTKEEEDELTKFINRAKHQGFNCLDLSKKNIAQFPTPLLEFPSLQYLYLEGNGITKLPDHLFLQLPNLKWIDLRNNKITRIPGIGLDKNASLRYLLLSGNLIRTLPVELGKVKGLAALNLDGNPLEHPPLDIVKQGIKAIQQYLRDEHIRESKCANEKLDSDDEYYEVERQTLIVPDVWASSDEENEDQRRISRSPQHTSLSRPSLIFLRKSKSEASHYKSAATNPLTIHLQSCIRHHRVSYSEMRMHHLPSGRRRVHSDIKLPRLKPKPITKKNNQPTKTISNDPEGDAYVARAHEEQRLRCMKHRNMKITEELEKVKSKDLLHEWKEDYRSTQQQLRRKRLVKGKDYQEAVAQAPFGIDPHYISVMDKDQQEFVEKAIRYESRRNRSPESAMRDEEERRIRDRQVQERIREITGKIIKRRGEVRGNASDEKRQAEVELRELRKLETEIKQRRTQIDTRFKAYTGDVKARKKL
ncbi:unnamed protein product [Rotaria socialis]|uniref:Leucine-rich repeat-containing protein 27 n=2 Tax=Rotaria socialis TaxID=392032 RepID=A0A817XWW2_9BILA|nr:unnamed protein product [Rotaria socialis]